MASDKRKISGRTIGNHDRKAVADSLGVLISLNWIGILLKIKPIRYF
jgi:hypothetical protein